MTTILLTLFIILILFFGLPAIINMNMCRKENDKLLSNMQNLDPKWNSGVVRMKNGRFTKKDEIN